MSGPQFEEQKSKGVMVWIKQNQTKTIAGIIALIALIGGLYLFNSGNNNSASVINENNQETTQNDDNQNQNINLPDNQNNQTEIPPTETVTNETIKETAQPGQGITHLARKAAKTYISQHSELNGEISKEQKIFIEDYLKDKIKEGLGKSTIEVNEKISFDNNLIQEAIDASKQLTENQLNNLSKYVNLVPSL